jgi:hypothetical protein
MHRLSLVAAVVATIVCCVQAHSSTDGAKKGHDCVHDKIMDAMGGDRVHAATTSTQSYAFADGDASAGARKLQATFGTIRITLNTDRLTSPDLYPGT